MKYLIRLEYFGGVIFNLNNFERKEISFDDAIFLKSLQLTGDMEYSTIITNHILKKSSINNGVYNENEVIKELSKNSDEMSFEKALKVISEKVETIKKIECLFSPLEITFYPSLRCNLNCRFCFVNNKKSNIEKNAEYWISIAQEAFDNDVLSISILGGEPTMYYDIDKLLEGLNEIGILVTITTNGVDMKDSTFDIICKSENITPVVSIQCFTEKNRSLMGVDSKIQEKLVHRFCRMDKKIRINSVYTEQTFDEIYEMIDFTVANKIDRISFATYFGNNDKNNLNCNHSIKDSRELNDKLLGYIKMKYPDNSVNFAVEGCLLYSAYPEIEDEINKLSVFDIHYYGCRAGQSKLEIYSDGLALPCISFENEITNKSYIMPNHLLDFWHNDKFINELRLYNTEDRLCKTCGFKIMCKGGCPADRMKKYGDEFTQKRDMKCLK